MSEEQLRDQTQERWRETLALLGLPADPESAPPPAQSAPEPVLRSPAAIQEVPPSPERERPAPAFDTPADDFGPSETAAYEEPGFGELGEEEESRPPEPFLEAVAPAEPPETEEETQSRGRRRGRRGGRSRSQRGEESTSGRALDTASADEERDAEASAPPREDRSRGRGQERQSEMPHADEQDLMDDDEDQEIDALPEESAKDEREEEPDTLSDWNVPSWQELISSLYRPDR